MRLACVYAGVPSVCVCVCVGVSVHVGVCVRESMCCHTCLCVNTCVCYCLPLSLSFAITHSYCMSVIIRLLSLPLQDEKQSREGY